MDLASRNESITELKRDKNRLMLVVVALAIGICFAVIKMAFQTAIVVQQTPGMPNNATIEKSTMDKGSQMATLIALTSGMVQINPANSEYAKAFVQVFLAPAIYTKVSKEIDNKVAMLVAQRELGSYYFVFKAYDYDPKLDTHFIRGEVHTVNAAKDTPENWVYEYKTHVENYRLIVDGIKPYTGETLHNSEWYDIQKKLHK
ncbi:type VI secretion protein [Pelomonas sp. HMWF004]|nr:type VI secretion protein [Pelomonas sp. HMWF004]